MFRMLLKTDALAIPSALSAISMRTLRGWRRTAPRFSSVQAIVLDDDSMLNLEARTMCLLVPATLYSRMLATYCRLIFL